MIVFDLVCLSGGHRFEGWFGSTEDFEEQQERGFLTCPQCGGMDIDKAVMAPRVGRKGNQAAAPAPERGKAPAGGGAQVSNGKIPPEAAALMKQLARMQTEALKSSRWVGENFADDARAMHYGERDMESIHGEATSEQAKDLIDEGIAVAPLPFPVVPPDKAN